MYLCPASIQVSPALEHHEAAAGTEREDANAEAEITCVWSLIDLRVLKNNAEQCRYVLDIGSTSMRKTSMSAQVISAKRHENHAHHCPSDFEDCKTHIFACLAVYDVFHFQKANRKRIWRLWSESPSSHWRSPGLDLRNRLTDHTQLCKADGSCKPLKPL